LWNERDRRPQVIKTDSANVDSVDGDGAAEKEKQERESEDELRRKDKKKSTNLMGSANLKKLIPRVDFPDPVRPMRPIWRKAKRIRSSSDIERR